MAQNGRYYRPKKFRILENRAPRVELRSWAGKMVTAVGEIDRIDRLGINVAVKNIKIVDEKGMHDAADHVWIRVADNSPLKLTTSPGDKVQFVTQVVSYNRRGEQDYSLADPSSVRLVGDV